MPVTRRTDFFLIAAVAAVFVGVALVASLEKALAAGVSCGVLLSIAQTKWDRRHDRLFQVVIAIFVAIHIVAIWLIKFPTPRFGLIALPFAMADGFLLWAILNWLDKRFPRPGSDHTE